MKKRIMSIVVTLAMVVAMLPASAFAATNYFAVTKDGNTTEYETLAAAVESVGKDETATIKLLDNYKGPGVKVGNKFAVNITFDLDGKTMDITGTVGSQGTETNGFQLLKGSTVKFVNGKITSNTAKLLFQNYANLTLEKIDASLTTDSEDVCVVSSNNGRTEVIDSIVTTSKGLAMDSDTFGNYDGGDVLIDADSVVNGNVQATNGGKMQIDGYVAGDLHVYNYAYDHNEQKAAKVYVNGVVDGKLLVENLGQVEAANAIIDIVEVNGEDASAVLNSGMYRIVQGADLVNDDYVIITDKDGNEYHILGADFVQKAIKAAASENELAKVTVVRASEGTKLDVPAGVVVENNSDTDVVVNDKTVAAGESLTVPAKPGAAPQEKPAEGVDTPDTGDSLPMLPFVGFFLAALTFAGAFVIRRKKTN